MLTRVKAAKWTLLTNHGAVLLFVAQERKVSARRIAQALDLAERSVQRILGDLEESGYLAKREDKKGRINEYEVDLGHDLRRPDVHPVTVGDLFQPLLTSKEKNTSPKPSRTASVRHPQRGNRRQA